MTREETLAIMSVLKAAYPNYYREMRRDEAEAIVGLWTEMFKDDPAEVVAVAVKAHIATDKKGFPPHIGAIREAITKIKAPKEMTELEAWGKVLRAINGASMSPNSRRMRNGVLEELTSAERNFNALPEVLQRLVGSPSQLSDWAKMDTDVVNSVVASNFQRSYNARAKHERERLALPGDVRQVMDVLSEGMRMPALTDGGNANG